MSAESREWGRHAESKSESEHVLEVSSPSVLTALLPEQVSPAGSASSTATMSDCCMYTRVDTGVRYVFVLCSEYPVVRKETTLLGSTVAWIHCRVYIK